MLEAVLRHTELAGLWRALFIATAGGVKKYDEEEDMRILCPFQIDHMLSRL